MQTTFRTEEGATLHAGLVCWQDWNTWSIVCQMTSTMLNLMRVQPQGGQWYHQDSTNYNKDMGGVDLADMH
jgi:hypothetical protein